jgi:hypothetical protein
MWRNIDMKQYDKRILESLIDSYENSSLSRGENKINIRIDYKFTRKNLPEYFDESSMEYEEIHAVVRELSDKGFIQIVWKAGRENHIIEKVYLCEEQIQDIYDFLNRKPKLKMEQDAFAYLKNMERAIDTPAASAFIQYLKRRLEERKSVKDYVDITDLEKTGLLINAVSLAEKNTGECFIREFSIQNFKDSKVFEIMIPKICRILRDYYPEYEEMENDEILAEYHIYHTPGYVYIKGDANISLRGQQINLSYFKNGFGFSLDDEDSQLTIEVVSYNKEETLEHKNIENVYTIENLTNFFRFNRSNSLIIYLGGYHNTARRKLLKTIYSQFPNADFWHFGDIDVGGFLIYEDLCKKTGIPFKRYNMDLETFRKYENYSKKLTQNDRTRIEKILNKNPDIAYADVLRYMLKIDKKLEQECIVEENS